VFRYFGIWTAMPNASRRLAMWVSLGRLNALLRTATEQVCQIEFPDPLGTDKRARYSLRHHCAGCGCSHLTNLSRAEIFPDTTRFMQNFTGTTSGLSPFNNRTN
jgi:hypothetical protein